MIVAIALVLALPLGVVADRIVAQGVRVMAILALLAFANSRHTVSVRLARPWDAAEARQVQRWAADPVRTQPSRRMRGPAHD